VDLSKAHCSSEVEVYVHLARRAQDASGSKLLTSKLVQLDIQYQSIFKLELEKRGEAHG
jgi:hypothetical protein